jgi:hypothetical protein
MANTWLEYRIEDGLIVNAIVYDGISEYVAPEGLGLVERGESDGWIGWTYDAETRSFIPPASDE